MIQCSPFVKKGARQISLFPAYVEENARLIKLIKRILEKVYVDKYN